MPAGLGNQGSYLLVRKNIFGMPEAPCDLYYANLNFMHQYGLKQSIFDPCVYIPDDTKKNEWPMLFVILFVDGGTS